MNKLNSPQKDFRTFLLKRLRDWEHPKFNQRECLTREEFKRQLMENIEVYLDTYADKKLKEKVEGMNLQIKTA
jgi:hypothetical protein